jgi:hypothetical protein
MRLTAVITGALGAALLLASPQREAFAHESRWLRWRPTGGFVQHILINDGTASKTMTVAPLISGNCDESQRSIHLKADQRFSSTVTVELQPGAWFALWTPIAERSIGCTVDLMVAGGNEPTRKLTSTELTREPYFLDTLPFEGGQLRVDASVVADDMLAGFEPPGTSLQVQVRVLNLSSDARLLAITKRRLSCDKQGRFDWVLGPGEPPVEIAAGPAVIKAEHTAVFSQRLRGSGDPGGCRAFFSIDEARRPRKSAHVVHEEPPVWSEVKALEVRLKRNVEAVYR